jgi:hypothetical protein
MIDIKQVMEQYEFLRGYKDEAGNIVKNFVMRSMTGYEEDLMASKNIQPLEKFNKLLVSCCESIGDVTDKAKIEEIIRKKLSSQDRLFMIVCLRRVTVGDLFTFTYTCGECNKDTSLNLDLSKLENISVSDMKYYEEPIKVNLYGNEFVLKISTSETEKIQAQFNIKEDAPSFDILSRIVSINGVVPTLEDIKKLPLKIRNELRHIFNEMEGKVDLEVEAVCSNPDCRNKDIIMLDVSHRNFFYQREI